MKQNVLLCKAFPFHWRRLVLRTYWDSKENPSIERPYGDFFANG